MLLLLSFTEKLISISKNYCNNSLRQATFSTFIKLLIHNTLFNHFVGARLSKQTKSPPWCVMDYVGRNYPSLCYVTEFKNLY